MASVPKEILSELEKCGLPWEIKHGRQHFKIFVADRLAGVFSKSVRKNTSSVRASRNVCSQIRRLARELMNS